MRWNTGFFIILTRMNIDELCLHYFDDLQSICKVCKHIYMRY